MSTIPSISSSLPLKPHLKSPKPLLNLPYTRKKSSFPFRIPEISRRSSGGLLTAVACSTSSPFTGKVGWHRRDGNLSWLSFGKNHRIVAAGEGKADSSEVLSALLPFVVVLTAVSALSYPYTFTW
nr:probable sodium/metabolite cotransporter BASS3, chloroplastic [Ipomoea batatas]